MSSLVISGDTSGAVTLQAPSVSGTTTLTLPSVSGTVITTGSSGQVIPKAALPTGSVLQVVNATYATEVSTSSNTLSDTGLTASITPTSSTSKILVLVDMSGVSKSTGNTQTNLGFYLLRASTQIIQFEYTATYTGTDIQNRVGSVSCNYLDSPATTSSTTYKVQFNSNGSSGTGYVQRGSGGGGTSATSTITLMEIAA